MTPGSLSPANAICVLTGDCLPPGISLPPEYRFVHVLRTTRAHELVTTKVVLDQLLLEEASIVLPGWVVRWRDYLRVQGERAFRQVFQQTATKIVMLDTGVGDDASNSLREFSRFTRLPYEIIPVGMELFSSRLARCVLSANLMREQAKRRALEENLSS